MTLHRSLGTSPFVLFGSRARLWDEVCELLEKEWISEFQEDRDEIRDHVEKNIAKIQEENRREFKRKRKRALTCRENDLMAIKCTQQEPVLKLVNKCLGTYKVVKGLRNNWTHLGKWVITKVHGKHLLLPIM